MAESGRQQPLPYVHDLEALPTRLAEAGHAVPEPIWQAVQLTPFAVESRYPSVGRAVTEAQYAAAVDMAATVLRWAEDVIR